MDKVKYLESVQCWQIGSGVNWGNVIVHWEIKLNVHTWMELVERCKVRFVRRTLGGMPKEKRMR